MYIQKILTLFFIIICYSSFGQDGFPTVINYEKNEYKAGRQNWDIDIDKDGIVYFGNSKGLLYNVHGDWGFKTMSKSEDIRSVFVHKDTIWCGGNEIGFFTKLNGDYKFTSLGKTNGGPVWNIVYFDNHIVFQCENQIIKYNLSTKKISFTYFAKIDAIAEWNNAIWVAFNNGELGYLEGLNFVKTNKFKQIENKEVRKMVVHNNLLYLIMLNGELLSFDGEKISKVNVSSSLKNNNFFTGINYNNNSFCLGTVSNGFVQIDYKGDVLKQISTKNNLLDDTVLSMKADGQGNVWLGLDYGIAKIELESPINSVFKKATTFDILDFKDKTYLATNKGLFESFGNAEFKFIDNSKGQIWKLKSINNQLYICHNSGLLIKEKNKLIKISSLGGVIDIANFKGTNMYLFTTYNGLLLVRKDGNSFESIKNLNFWGKPKLIFDNTNNCIWAEVKEDQVYKFTINKNLEVDRQDFPKIKKVFKTNLGIFFADSNNILKYNGTEFTKSTNPLLENINGLIDHLNFNVDGSSVAYVKNNQINNQILLPDGNIYSFNSSLKLLSKGLIKGSEFIKIRNNKLYIALERSLKTFDYNFKSSLKAINKPKVSSVTILNDNRKKLFFPYDVNEISLSKGKKDINFNFNINHSLFDYAEHRFRLLPIEKEWSDWSADVRSALYTNVEGGKYTLELQSKVNNGKIKQTALNVNIEKLWHETPLIFLLYFLTLSILIMVIIFAMNHLNQKKLERQQAKHKQENMQKTLFMKNEQLLQYTEIISHKNEFLNRVKDGLEKLKDPKIKRFINIISKEVNTEKKDFLFHKLFSEVHQDFISRITEAYPTLTANDVRMLSYIRINLDKKEISNLMNISSRSVDMNRYRLRKKLNLEKGIDLNIFVINY